jgi:L,D-peptidoglycan transpeptidase YkuD (ErfK/YbiS/YcfS/YnhG family)
LPLTFTTANATQVITVVAPSTASTTGTLQAWQRGASGWSPVGSALTAYLGTAGMSSHPSESSTATPIGSFTLTQAFGHDPNPGTALPYRQTTPDDWWISQPGPLYNTLQRCATSCPFVQGDPNEHLYEEMPYYTYAVVIDYNRSPVVQGAGSAFFLHVTVGQPTQGCVSIPLASLASLMRWLTPAAHPRILIGVGG